MALDNTTIDLNRTELDLPAQIAAQVIAAVEEQSAVMQLAQQIALPGTGAAVPVILGDATADFVGETHEKPVSEADTEIKRMIPQKIAVIELFSNEFKRDLPALYDELVRRLPAAIGKKFDEAIFTMATADAPTGFDVLSGATAQAIDPADVYGSLVAAYTGIGAAGFDVSGWAVSPAGRGVLLGATDGAGRPIFVGDTQNGGVGAVLGAPVVNAPRAYDADTNLVGFVGDWSQARWGIVEGIKIAISEEATINNGTKQVNLWQRNMFAVRVEAEVGFIANDDAFQKLTYTAE